MKQLLTHLIALMIVVASYIYRPRPLASCARCMRTEYPFDVVERKIDLFLEGLLNG